MTPKDRWATSSDVAAQAGVSRATASYVLNGRTDKRISESTRDRVLRAAEELGYVPNAAAVALKSGRTDVVLFDVPYWPMGSPVVVGTSTVVETLEGLGYTPLVHFQTGSTDESLAVACRRLQPVGLISSGRFLTESRVAELYANGVVALVALHDRPLGHVPTSVFDQTAVGELAVGFLATRGHRRIIALMPRRGSEVRVGTDRLKGAKRAASKRGIEVCVVEATLDHDEVTSRLRDVVERRNHSAIYAFNDEYARAAQPAIHALGLTVPDDVALLGCDDGPLAHLGWPRLSSISLTTQDRWTAIARSIHDLIEGKPAEPPTLAELRVIERDTT